MMTLSISFAGASPTDEAYHRFLQLRLKKKSSLLGGELQRTMSGLSRPSELQDEHGQRDCVHQAASREGDPESVAHRDGTAQEAPGRRPEPCKRAVEPDAPRPG